ncbi:MAG: hypothetical protein ACRDT6_26300, partial [Micromonosporaceae bacterium]
ELAATGREAAVLRALLVRPRPDSAGLSAADRARLAGSALRARRDPDRVVAAVSGRGRPGTAGGLRARRPAGGQGKSAVSAAPAVVLVDDVMTTGATIAAASQLLVAAGVRVDAAAVLAATERRYRHSG